MKNLSAFIPVNEPQHCITVEERIYLVDADSFELAERKAEELGRLDAEAGSKGLTVGDAPAVEKFLGVRSVKKIFPPVDADRDLENAIPEDGAEISYTFFEVKTLDDALALAEGRDVPVLYHKD